MLERLEHTLLHTLEDNLVVIPLLFLTYLVMEYLEHRAGEKTAAVVGKAGKWGPLVGSLAGAVPQCGFSAAASNLYAGRVITMGTLIAIYLSTSDEMLPVMLSERAPASLIVRLILAKIVIGMAAGFLLNWLMPGEKPGHAHVHELCEKEHCHCEKGILRSALVHTLKITAFLLLIGFALNLVLELAGEDALSGLILGRRILGPVLAGIVGLIPNCAASVAVTKLYLDGIIGLGTMMAGLLVGAGVGLLVLFRTNRDRMDNVRIVGILYAIGVLSGIVMEFVF